MSVKESVSIQETVDFLNDLLSIDPDTINNLSSIRVGCNKTMADHPTVQVACLSDNYFIVGIIGILNGLFGSDEHGWGHISADYEGSKVKRFRVLSNQDVEKYTANKQLQQSAKTER
ncbi:MAG: hypothetical protein PVG39_25840 [Desulfobacteraceae bacterium]|jgi:hypothetical protein